MIRPGVSRAFSGAIIGFLAGAGFVLGLRALQNMDPLWDPAVALVLTPFTMMAGWMWGIGAFNPKLSAHGEHAIEEGAEEESSPFALMMSQIWPVTASALVIILCFYAIAAFPTGLFAKTTGVAEGDVGSFATGVVLAVPFVGEIHTTQLVLLLAFVGFAVFSMVIFAGLLGFLFYKGSEQVAIAQQIQPGPAELTPPAPLRALGRGATGLAKGLRSGLPKILGGK